MARSSKRPMAVLHIALLRILAVFIAKMRTISMNMANHPSLFPAPSPSLATFNTNIDTLEADEAVASTHVTGSAAIRDKQYDVVLDNVHNLQAYVQTLADNTPDEADARILILNSGFDLKADREYIKPDFEVRNTDVSGVVELIAKSSGQGTANEWRMSLDRTSWIILPGTKKARTLVMDLTPATTVYFQHRPIIDEKVRSWSQVVSIVVI